MQPESEGLLHKDSQTPFPARQLLLLALCRIAEPIALTSPLPYAYDMMLHMGEPIRSNAGLYSGLFIAAFSFAETLTAFWWGSLSDRIGRKPVILLGCAGTFISLLFMGFAANIWLALLGRLLGGGLNGNMGVVQTMVGEMVTNPRHEPRAYAVMPFFFTIGCTIGPAIGGLFARPEDSWPSSFGKLRLFTLFPYLLPNLVCALLMLITIILATLLLEETHARFKEEQVEVTDVETTTVATRDEAESPLLRSRNSTSGVAVAAPKSSVAALSWRIWNPIIAACFLTGHTLTYIQLLPILLQTPPDTSVPRFYPLGIGGLNLSLSLTGQIMAVSGFISLGVQSLLFPLCTTYFSPTALFLFVTTLHPLAYFGAPYLAFISPGTWRMVVLFIWITNRTIFSVFAYPLILVFVKRATPHNDMLGWVNGMVASTGAAFRTLTPPVAGFLETLGEKKHISVLPWWGSGVLALGGTVQGWIMVRQMRKWRA